MEKYPTESQDSRRGVVLLMMNLCNQIFLDNLLPYLTTADT
jgi:hypothetical protein